MSSFGDPGIQCSLPGQDLHGLLSKKKGLTYTISKKKFSPAVKTNLLKEKVGIDTEEEDEVEVEEEKEDEEEEEKEKYLYVRHAGRGDFIYILEFRSVDKFTNYPQPLPILYIIRPVRPLIPFPIKTIGLDQSVGTMEFKRAEDMWMHGEDIVRCMDELSRLSLGLFTAHPSLPLPDAFPPLKNPKFSWPVVEKIGNQIHIFDSVPYGMSEPSVGPSHQVLDLDDPNPEWVSVPPLKISGFDLFVSCGHVVVGAKIFAKHEWFHYEEYSVFDTYTRQWEVRKGYSIRKLERHLTQYSTFEYSVCAQQFYRMGCESPSYILIMFDRNSLWSDDDISQVSAMALCVTEEGDVMWTQHLPQFFDRLPPMSLSFAHVFRVDEKTMCVVMFAYYHVFYLGEREVENVLYVSTFCMDEGSQCQEGGVKVVLKERQIYKAGEDFPILPQRLRASISTLPH